MEENRKANKYRKKLRNRWSMGPTMMLSAAIMLAGCSNTGATGTNTVKQNARSSAVEQVTSEQVLSAQVTLLNISDMFTNRDREIGYDESECVIITLQGDSALADSKDVKIDGSVVTITVEGTYLLRGELQGQVIVDADKKDKIQLVLDGANISCQNSAALYVSQADKVFVTTVSERENLFETTGEYVNNNEHNIDGAVFSREDITFNGEGMLKVVSASGNGLVCKDDLVITSGSYEITAGKHGLEGKDSVRIANGDIIINAEEDGIHSGNDEDDTVGYTYIAGGNITLTVGDDAIHSDTQLVVAGGTIRITESYEGLEGLSIEIAGGEIDVKSRDDGLNAAGGNDGSGMMGRFRENPFAVNEDACILISGGKVTVDADGDGIDSNGNLYVSGGEIVIYGPADNANGALDYDGNAEITGGSVIALGAKGMAQNFGPDSTQCSILVNFQNNVKAGTTVELKDGTGKVLMSCVSAKSFNSAVFSLEDIRVGETYIVTAGEESLMIEMTETIYGRGMGGFGPGGGFGGFGGSDHGDRGGFDRGNFDRGDRGGNGGPGSDGRDGDRDGRDREEFQRPDGEMPQVPDGKNPRIREGGGRQFEDGGMPWMFGDGVPSS